MNSVRTSGLNFTLQDTPFSMVLTLRKFCIKQLHHHPLPQPQDLQHHDQNLMDIFLLKLKFLAEALLKIQVEKRVALKKCEFNDRVIQELETKVRQLTSDMIEATSKYSMKASQHKSSSVRVKDEKKVLEVINSEVLKLMESLEMENEELLRGCPLITLA